MNVRGGGEGRAGKGRNRDLRLDRKIECMCSSVKHYSQCNICGVM